jgi:predicted Zn-dependent peptidase
MTTSTPLLGFALATMMFQSPMASADKLDRGRRPPIGPEPAVTAPPVVKRTLSNGLPVWMVSRPGLPHLTAVLVIRAGSADDPKPGTAAFTAALLDDGTAVRSAREFVHAVDFLGASLTASASEEQTRITLQTLTRHLDPALELMGEMVSRPAFKDEEVERERKARIQSLKQQRDQPVTVANLVFQRVVYGMDHPYGRPLMGTVASVEGLTERDAKAFHQRFYAPANAVLVVVGDLTDADLTPRLERAFGGWKGESVAPAPAPARPPERRAGVYLVDKPGAAQSEIRIGHAGAPRTTSPDYYALQVMNTLLGGQFTSRVNLNLREQKGFTYGARSQWSFRRGDGPFYAAAGVFTAKTDSAVTEFLKELRELRGGRPATEQEVEFARNALVRSHPRRLETNDAVASILAELAFYGLPESEITDYNRRVAEVTPEEVTRVAAKYIAPEQAAVVVVGDLAKVRGGVEALGIGPVMVLDPDGQELAP